MQLQVEKNILVNNKGGRDFLADIYAPVGEERWPLLVFCHGYKGFKDWGAWDLAMRKIAQAGNVVVKFNFSHNGTTIDNPLEFDDLEAFGNNNFSKEIQDIDTVINHFIVHGNVNPEKVILLGHSRGGGIALIKAYEDERVKALVTWAGVSNFTYRFPNDYRLQRWQETGVFYTENMRTHQQMPHYYQFYEDFKANENRFTIQLAAQNFKKPCLIIQGTNDEAVKDKEAELLHLWIKESQMLYLENANHTFGAKHPWERDTLPEDLEKVVAATIDFIKSI